MADKKKIPTRPKDPRKAPSPPKGSSKTKTSGSSSKTSKPKSASQLQKEAENRAIKRENDLRLKSGMRFNEAAVNLNAQIKAIKNTLQVELASSRDQNLADIDMMLNQQLGQLRTDAEKRGLGFLSAARDTERATSDVQEAGFRNLVRERADSMTAVLEQGAGETDAMRALLAAARNWHANASEANRSYFDTMQSINQGITDLNIDTKTAMSNAHMTAEGQRETIWNDFYNRRAEAMTQLGNVYGQQADYMNQAKEMGVKFGKIRTKRLSDAEKGMKDAFADASTELGKSYTQQGLPEWISGYEGTAQQERRQANSELAAAVTFDPMAKAEGATLRKWAA